MNKQINQNYLHKVRWLAALGSIGLKYNTGSSEAQKIEPVAVDQSRTLENTDKRFETKR